MIIKLKNLYVFWFCSALCSVGAKLIDLMTTPWIELMAMQYGGLTLLTTYWLFVKIGILHEKVYEEKK